MKRLVPVVGSCVSAVFGMQLYANDRVQCETASVKQTTQCASGSNQLGPGIVALKGVPLKPVLMAAFKVGSDQVAGPSWLESDCFEVLAKLPEGSATDQIPMMLQTLLEQRFKLSAHKESRSGEAYTLAIDKGGAKLKESKEDSTFMAGRPRGTKATRRDGGGIKGAMTMEALAKALSGLVGGPVVDATGLKGEFEIDLNWSPGPAPTEPGIQRDGVASPPMGDLFSAIRDSLGLKLEARKTQVEFLVIDHIERVPTGN